MPRLPDSRQDKAKILPVVAAAPVRRVGLANSQNVAFEFIKEFLAANGFAPTFREIGAAIGARSTNHVSQIVDQLVKRGYIVKLAKSSRSIAIVPEERRCCPHCGKAISA